MPREISQERLIKDVHRVLDNPFFIPTLEPGVLFSRTHDDTDGTGLGKIGVSFTNDGDAWFSFEAPKEGRVLRFRNWIGGGQSTRTHMALLILAEAMRLDNEERPQERG